MPKFEKNRASQLLSDIGSGDTKDSLSDMFDKYNGDFDTPREFVRAYFQRDKRALSSLSLQNMEQLRDVLEAMFPKMREILKEETSTPQKLQQYLADLANKNTPKPIP